MISVIRQNGNGHKFEVNFVKYAQSSQCITMKDSSVSYAAASLTIK
jgi:predicted class III extradiol MEMO1 family dioxygenase